MAVLYNPTDRAIDKELKLPHYSTGLQITARISEVGKPEQTYTRVRAYNVHLKVPIPPA